MSGKPNLDQIIELKKHAQRIYVIVEERNRQISIRDTAIGTISDIDEEYRMHFKEVHRLLTEMDVAANGNFGWEQRIAFFLSNLVGVET